MSDIGSTVRYDSSRIDRSCGMVLVRSPVNAPQLTISSLRRNASVSGSRLSFVSRIGEGGASKGGSVVLKSQKNRGLRRGRHRKDINTGGFVLYSTPIFRSRPNIHMTLLLGRAVSF